MRENELKEIGNMINRAQLFDKLKKDNWILINSNTWHEGIKYSAINQMIKFYQDIGYYKIVLLENYVMIYQYNYNINDSILWEKVWSLIDTISYKDLYVTQNGGVIFRRIRKVRSTPLEHNSNFIRVYQPIYEYETQVIIPGTPQKNDIQQEYEKLKKYNEEFKKIIKEKQESIDYWFKIARQYLLKNKKLKKYNEEFKKIINEKLFPEFILTIENENVIININNNQYIKKIKI